jgi:hypothetical protein
LNGSEGAPCCQYGNPPSSFCNATSKATSRSTAASRAAALGRPGASNASSTGRKAAIDKIREASASDESYG